METVKTHTLDTEDLLKLATEHMREIYRDNGSMGELYLVVGYDEFYRLTDQQMSQYPWTMNMGAYLSGRMPPIRGMKVLFVPWINGCFILPRRLIDEANRQ